MSNIGILHQKIAADGVPILGVSNSLRDGIPGTRRVDFLPAATQPQRIQAEAIADGFNTLTITADKTTILVSSLGASENNPAKIATLTCGNLTTFDYTIWRDTAASDLDSQGTVNDGSLEFIATSAGNYLIEIKSGNATGYIEIEAVNE